MPIDRFKSRRKAKRLIYSPAAIVVLVLALALLGRSTWDIYDKYRLSEDRLSQADSQLAGLKIQEESLSGSIDSLSTEQGVEAALRTDFRVVKPGESLAVIVGTATAAPATSSPQGFWAGLQSWWSGLF